MRHEMLTQRTFLPSRAIQKGYAKSAFCDACRTSSDTNQIMHRLLVSSTCVAAVYLTWDFDCLVV